MRLFLFRHADATPGMPDEARPLSDRGYAQIDKLIRHLDTDEFDGILAIEHSPLLRAVQTAEYFKKRTGLKQPLKLTPTIRPDDDPNRTAELVAKGDTDRLLVGHNPHHEMLAGMLLGQGRATVQVAFKKASVLALERFAPPTKSTPYGYWQLRWFVVPAALD
jgi:phosphohistidine phosphatase